MVMSYSAMVMLFLLLAHVDGSMGSSVFTVGVPQERDSSALPVLATVVTPALSAGCGCLSDA